MQIDVIIHKQLQPPIMHKKHKKIYSIYVGSLENGIKEGYWQPSLTQPTYHEVSSP
jgi:hypothetical protein